MSVEAKKLHGWAKFPKRSTIGRPSLNHIVVFRASINYEKFKRSMQSGRSGEHWAGSGAVLRYAEIVRHTHAQDGGSLQPLNVTQRASDEARGRVHSVDLHAEAATEERTRA